MIQHLFQLSMGLVTVLVSFWNVWRTAEIIPALDLATLCRWRLMLRIAAICSGMWFVFPVVALTIAPEHGMGLILTVVTGWAFLAAMAANVVIVVRINQQINTWCA